MCIEEVLICLKKADIDLENKNLQGFLLNINKAQELALPAQDLLQQVFEKKVEGFYQLQQGRKAEETIVQAVRLINDSKFKINLLALRMYYTVFIDKHAFKFNIVQLKHLMKIRQWSEVKLAKKLGLDYTYIYCLLRGDRQAGKKFYRHFAKLCVKEKLNPKEYLIYSSLKRE